MSRKTTVRAASLAVLSATMFLVITAACEPLPVMQDCRGYPASPLDGTWNLASINGDPLPAPDPTQPGRIITKGELFIHTSTVYGACDPPVNSSGGATGTVNYTEAGSPQSRWSSAHFFAYHLSSDIDLTATEGKASGTFSSSQIVFTNISDARFVLKNVGVATLIFNKASN